MQLKLNNEIQIFKIRSLLASSLPETDTHVVA
jgi:hypothetical protein